ncbi:secreted protein [Candidatus Magnetoovum chiemensis]|nr:secreted protein [Candidatus Magnetoovum chiemensis]
MIKVKQVISLIVFFIFTVIFTASAYGQRQTIYSFDLVETAPQPRTGTLVIDFMLDYNPPYSETPYSWPYMLLADIKNSCPPLSTAQQPAVTIDSWLEYIYSAEELKAYELYGYATALLMQYGSYFNDSSFGTITECSGSASDIQYGMLAALFYEKAVYEAQERYLVGDLILCGYMSSPQWDCTYFAIYFNSEIF